MYGHVPQKLRIILVSRLVLGELLLHSGPHGNHDPMEGYQSTVIAPKTKETTLERGVVIHCYLALAFEYPQMFQRTVLDLGGNPKGC